MRRFQFVLAVLAAMACACAAVADVVDANTQPPRAALVAGVDAFIPLTWQVTVDQAGDPGATSTVGLLVNATTGAQIAPPVVVTLSNLTGRGVLLFPEVLTIDGDQIATWLQQGIRRVGYRRTFTSPGSTPQSAQLLLTLSGSTLDSARDGTAAQLQITRMELAFESGNRIEIADAGEQLTARLTVGYGGSGTLRGRWQIAEPGGGNRPFFRTIALVRETLAPVQRAVIDSPLLPTQVRGRYVLRFCLEPTDAADEECADSSSSVQTLYEIAAQGGAAEIRTLQPNGLAAGPGTPFRWSEVTGAITYQLQIFLPGTPAPGALLDGDVARTATAPGTDDADEVAASGHDPQFVTGLLVPAGTSQTALSELVRSRLQPGQRYLWRVTAHDADGRLLASSRMVSFVYEI
ncbi:MAG TPA: hypothetical protein VFR59_02030 [Steroidobacteraceae bacterium]|nr:hypothetical protein [Steroidobacteraceae bacterium]